MKEFIKDVAEIIISPFVELANSFVETLELIFKEDKQEEKK